MGGRESASERECVCLREGERVCVSEGGRESASERECVCLRGGVCLRKGERVYLREGVGTGGRQNVSERKSHRREGGRVYVTHTECIWGRQSAWGWLQFVGFFKL